MQRENVWRALNVLPERERQVIEMRYGLTAGSRARSRRSASAFGVTRERIRQIENNTLKKLQKLPEAQRLRELQYGLGARPRVSRIARADPGECPSGQRERSVKPSAQPT